jgi:hypothetical protein
MRDDGRPESLYDVLHQGEWWVNKEKEWVRIEDIDLSYAENLYAFLMRHANRYGAFAAYYLRSQSFSFMTSGIQPSGDMACDAFDHMLDEMWEEAFLAERHTDRWFPGLELVKAVRTQRQRRRTEENERLAQEMLYESMFGKDPS